MTITALVSVSLLALVSTAQPIPKLDDDANHNYPRFGGLHSFTDQIQHAVQAVIASLPEAKFSKISISKETDTHLEQSTDDVDDVRIHVTSPELQEALLSRLEDASVKLLVPLGQDNIRTEDEAELFSILTRFEQESGRLTPVPDDALEAHIQELSKPVSSDLEPNLDSLDSGDLAEDVTVVQTASSMDGMQMSMPVLLASCIAALLLFMTVATVISIIHTLRKNQQVVLSNAWDILSSMDRRRRQATSDNNEDALLTPAPPRESQRKLDINLEKEIEKAPDLTDLKINTDVFDATVENVVMYSESPIFDEKPILLFPPDDTKEKENRLNNDDDEASSDVFLDALEMESYPSSVYTTPLITFSTLPSDESQTPSQSPSRYTNSNTLTIPSLPSTPNKRILRRSSSSSSSSSPTRTRNPPLESRALADPIKNPSGNRALDTALAMQLRPGLGLGLTVDAAWLVRFVMAFFGWCTVLISGRRPAQ